MAGKEASSNPLIITGRAPDASSSVQLHPLVLLTISDYITRHTLRRQEGPAIGAIIGQQTGRNYTLEHAFECKIDQQDGNVVVDGDWFTERLEQYKDVHKVAALDLVAMFMMGPVEGPQQIHVPLLKQVQDLTGTEGITLCLFHAELVDRLQGGKLPITLYESVQEQQEGEEVKMRFRELSFEVETGEAEMIGVDAVAKGGGNATAVTKIETVSAGAESSKKGKGKGMAKDKEEDESGVEGTSTNVLSPEDEELIASLTAKANAIKMLNQRIHLIRHYLTSLPQSYLTDASTTATSPPPPASTNHTLLRSVNSLLSRVPLLASPTATASDSEPPQTPLDNLHRAGEKERQDVHLTSLLAAMTRSISEAQTMGAKFHVLQREKQSKDRGPFSAGRNGGGGGAGFAEEGILGETGGF